MILLSLGFAAGFVSGAGLGWFLLLMRKEGGEVGSATGDL